jgi:hypothetical protein
MQCIMFTDGPHAAAGCWRRKLSGAFLACMKLRARVPCRDLFLQTYEQRTAAKAARRVAAQHSADRDQQNEEQLSQAEQVQVAGV